jgi:glycosyltransferase involved in cell wall biosynthesis
MNTVDLAENTSHRSGADAGLDEERSGERPAVFLMANEFSAGGTEIQFIRLAQALQKPRFDLQLGCIRHRGPLRNALGVPPIVEFPLDGGFLTATALRSARALARHLHAHKVAVAHSFSFYSNVLMIPVARTAGVPVVIGSQRQLGDLLTPLQRFAQGACFRLCDRIVCNSRAAAERLFGIGLRNEKVVVIPNAVSDEFFRAGDSRPLSRTSTGTIGLIARMNTRAKNHDLFLHAAARLCAKGFAGQFLLVGDGSRRNQLEELARQLGIADRTAFIGERNDIAEILSHLDVLALPSSSESSPNVIAEAMAAGVPVVATRVGGIPELIDHGNTGMLVPNGDEAAFADSLEYCLRNPEARESLARNAGKFAEKHFTLTAVRDRYECLYTQCLAEKAGTRRFAARRNKGSYVGRVKVQP